MLYFAKWKILSVVLVCVLGILWALPNALPEATYKALPDVAWLPKKRVHLGLDLQGGAHMLLEVGVKAVIDEQIVNLTDDTRSALRRQKIGYRGLGRAGKTNSVTVNIRKPEDVDKAYQALRALRAPLSGGLLGPTGQYNMAVSKLGGNAIRLNITDAAIRERISSALDQSIEIIRRRIDELGTTEPTIQRQGADRILVQVPGLDDPQRLKVLLGKTAKLVFRLVDTSVPPQHRPTPPGSEVLTSDPKSGPVETYLVKKRIMVSGEDLVDAQPSFDQRTNQPVVTFRFNSAGARRFGRVTQRNVNRPFAIVLDGKVVSAPVIQEPILGGSGQISGRFTVQEVNDLAILLRAGALPAPLTIIEERTVGPGLGADSIAAGKIASVIGLVAVVVFIIATYGLFGVFANIALAVNITLILGVLSLLQATLTLPGIAGIVLTIGMAVDANVLIYERIKEEARAGKSVIAAIDAGYSRALGTILDANITTFIAAAILFQLGSGPIRGFAITLAIGIITSVFTAFTLTRLLIAWWVWQRKPSAVPI
jgi:protein-export membrane protein SecD